MSIITTFINCNCCKCVQIGGRSQQVDSKVIKGCFLLVNTQTRSFLWARSYQDAEILFVMIRWVKIKHWSAASSMPCCTHFPVLYAIIVDFGLHLAADLLCFECCEWSGVSPVHHACIIRVQRHISTHTLTSVRQNINRYSKMDVLCLWVPSRKTSKASEGIVMAEYNMMFGGRLSARKAKYDQTRESYLQLLAHVTRVTQWHARP